MQDLILNRCGFALLLCCVFTACATPSLPPFSPIRGEKFGATPLPVQRMLVLVSFPVEYKVVIAEPLARDLQKQFKMLGFDVEVEVTTKRPPVRINPNIGNDQKNARATLLARMGDSTYTISFDLLDGQNRGVWRGSTSLNRLKNIEVTTNLLARDLLKKLSDDQVLIFPKRQYS